MTELKFKKVQRGLYVSTDGRYAVAHDGFDAIQSVAAEAFSGYEGFQGGEWAAVWTATDENMDWFSTKREAVAFCQRHAARAA